MSQPPARDAATLLRSLSSSGERAALSFYRGKKLEGRLSYGEFVTRVRALAGRLHGEFGVRAGDRVAILAPNRLEIPVLVFALLWLGAVVVPLNPGASPEDWSFILGHSGARGLCATRDLASQVPAAARPAFALEVEDAFASGTVAPDPPDSLGERMAVVLYTSGTTGRPKGVALRQRNLICNAWSMAENFHLRGTTQLAVLPLYHAHAFGFGLMTALSTAGHLVFTERLEPFTWADTIRRESVTVSSVVPTLLPMLLAAGITREKVPTLRHLMVSSAPLPVDLAREFESRTGIPLIQGWGLSEYTNFACCLSPDETREEHERSMFAWEVPSIGPALAGTEVKVAGAGGAPAEEGVRGELMIRGHSTMLGYYRDFENTVQAIDEHGWLRTGDEGLFRIDRGRPIYFVTGRLKEIIIRGAEKYSPLGIERQILAALPELSGKLVVLGFPHQTHGEEVGAYLEMEMIEDALHGKLAAALDALPLAERPKVVLHGARPISRTHTGKVQRRKMQSWFAAWATHRGTLVIRDVAASPDGTINS